MKNTASTLVPGISATMLGVIVISLNAPTAGSSRLVTGIGVLLVLVGLVTLLRLIVRSRAEP